MMPQCMRTRRVARTRTATSMMLVVMILMTPDQEDEDACDGEIDDCGDARRSSCCCCRSHSASGVVAGVSEKKGV